MLGFFVFKSQPPTVGLRMPPTPARFAFHSAATPDQPVEAAPADGLSQGVLPHHHHSPETRGFNKE